MRKALAHRPDVAIIDVQMPPNNEDDGLRAALELRHQLPDMGVLILSQFYEADYALDLIGDRARGVGYLLKERVADVATFVDAMDRVAKGGSALDPEVVGPARSGGAAMNRRTKLTPRENEVLAAMAEGMSNSSIAERWARMDWRPRWRSTSAASSRSSACRRPARVTGGRRPSSPTCARVTRAVRVSARHPPSLLAHTTPTPRGYGSPTSRRRCGESRRSWRRAGRRGRCSRP